MKKLPILLAAVGLVISGLSGTAQAIPVYGNSAGGTLALETFNVDTAAGTATEVSEFNPQSGNGRGMVVVGDVMHYTRVGDPNIYQIDKNTGVPQGSIATSVGSMSTIAYDGTNFWTTDYAGSNQGFYIDAVTGSTLNTVSFSQATGFMDGMEYFNGKLIVNRTDGGFGGPIVYDVYDLDGNLLTASFITATNGTGIAYDGTNFLVSDIYGNRLSVFDGSTGAFIKFIDLGPNTGDGRLIEDLSVDYAQRPDTGGGNGTVPEPASVLLLASGLGGLLFYGRKKVQG
jgi:hypothetical protein